MKRFSQRIGATEVPSIIQLESISDALRHSIWNFIHSLFDEGDSGWRQIAEVSSQFFFKLPVDELPVYNHRRHEWLKKQFYSLTWYEVYDYVEFVVEWYDKTRVRQRLRRDQLPVVFNRMFEEELSGYRFVGGELVPLSNPAEVAAIESALATTSATGLAGAHAHISAALSLLAKRPDPDYRNSIKESISAVEALTKQLGSPASQGLAGALTELGKKVPIHGGLRSGLLSLYGYTSDQGGIRHAMLEEPTLGYDDAKYMAVACSAFVNFLAAKAQVAGILVRSK
jgi:AbiJ N-terminal domain 4